MMQLRKSMKMEERPETAVEVVDPNPWLEHEKRGLAGVGACMLRQVSSRGDWSRAVLELIVTKVLQCPVDKAEALVPLLENDDSSHPDPEPFLSLIDEQERQEKGWLFSRAILHTLTGVCGYDARVRVLIRLLSKVFNTPWKRVIEEENKIGLQLYMEATGINGKDNKAKTKKRNFKDWKRNLKIGTAAVVGGGLLALTGGLALPAVAASLTALGGTGIVVGGALASAGGVTAGTILFGAAGAGLAGVKADHRTLGVQDFRFKLITSGDGMNVVICISGWLEDEDQDEDGCDFRRPWGDIREYLRFYYRRNCPEKISQIDSMLERYRGREEELLRNLEQVYEEPFEFEMEDYLNPTGENNESDNKAYDEKEVCRAWRWKSAFPSGDQYCLYWEDKDLRRFGTEMNTFAASKLKDYAGQEVIKQTAFAALFAAAALPLSVVKTASIIDNSWTIAMERADESGKLLAETLLKREQGLRPVTLVGYSMGARLIFSCLRHLVSKGDAGYGIIENAVLLGAPVPANKDEWEEIHQVVAGRLVNGYSEKDWMLGVMYRYQGWALSSAGFASIDCIGIENVDLSSVISSHLDYRYKLKFVMDILKLETK